MGSVHKLRLEVAGYAWKEVGSGGALEAAGCVWKEVEGGGVHIEGGEGNEVVAVDVLPQSPAAAAATDGTTLHHAGSRPDGTILHHAVPLCTTLHHPRACVY